MVVIELDGKGYNLAVTSIARGAKVETGNNDMEAKSGRKARDIKGTRYTYTLSIDSRLATPEEYDAFYEAITAPAESHVLKAPYGQTTLTFEAYVEDISDRLKAYTVPRRWGDLSIKFTAIEPQRKPGANEQKQD